jgi:hypothetical protein
MTWSSHGIDRPRRWTQRHGPYCTFFARLRAPSHYFATFTSLTLSIDSILQSDRLSTSRKEDPAFGFKHLVREGIHTKYQFLRPEAFLWNDELMGGAAGVITSGNGDQTRADWKVYEKPHILLGFKFAVIKHVARNAQSVTEGTTCSSCRSPLAELLHRCTQATDLRQNPIKSKHNNTLTLTLTPKSLIPNATSNNIQNNSCFFSAI